MRPLSAYVTRNTCETPDIVTVYFTLHDGSVLAYSAGQYVTVYFDGSSTPEGKAYSLSSAPHEAEMSITVKVIGEFSSKIAALQPGDTLHISEAYGHFGPKTPQPLACFTAGVGISPVWSILKDLHADNDTRNIDVYCSNKTVPAIPFKNELEGLVQTQPSLRLRHHITRQETVPTPMKKSRIEFSRYADTTQDTFYLVCGGEEFARTAWRELTKSGVLPDNISTETFFTS